MINKGKGERSDHVLYYLIKMPFYKTTISYKITSIISKP